MNAEDYRLFVDACWQDYASTVAHARLKVVINYVLVDFKDVSGEANSLKKCVEDVDTLVEWAAWVSADAYFLFNIDEFSFLHAHLRICFEV